jgi:diguanylate cyclase (GGDEF)-like protein
VAASAHLFRRARLVRKVAPFVFAMVVAFALLGTSPASVDRPRAVAAATAVAILSACCVLLPWRRIPRRAQALPPLALLPVIALMIDADGGGASPYGWLALLPVIWLALYGGPAQLSLAVAGAAALFVLPPFVVGAPRYPVTGIREGIVAALVSAIAGVTVQRLVRISRARAAELAEQTRALRRNEESIATVARELRSGARAREHIVRAARTITGGHFCVLWEAEGDGVLVSRTQLELGELRIDLAREASSAGVAFTSGERFFVPDARTHPACSPRLVEPTGVVSLLSQPVLSGDGVVGVLVVGWPDEVEESAQPLGALELLAAEAAIAIERAALEGELERAARMDALTGLSNRRVWEEELPRELARAERYGQPLSVALLDFDRFKLLNDRRGHQEGDRLLRGAAARWARELRDVDLLARYGGEEFAVLLPHSTPAEAYETIERVRAATPAGQTCSAGVATWDGRESEQSLVARADRALYEAKARGRDRTIADAGGGPSAASGGLLAEPNAS